VDVKCELYEVLDWIDQVNVVHAPRAITFEGGQALGTLSSLLDTTPSTLAASNAPKANVEAYVSSGSYGHSEHC